MLGIDNNRELLRIRVILGRIRQRKYERIPDLGVCPEFGGFHAKKPLKRGQNGWYKCPYKRYMLGGKKRKFYMARSLNGTLLSL